MVQQPGWQNLPQGCHQQEGGTQGFVARACQPKADNILEHCALYGIYEIFMYYNFQIDFINVSIVAVRFNWNFSVPFRTKVYD